MDKVVAFIKNVWFRRGVALACFGYTAFLAWISWLCLGYYFVLENPAPLFILYLFVNIAALGLLVFTRKQLITQINTFLIPIVVLVLMIFGFGQWFIIVPPMAVMVVAFFAARSNETLKTVFGTLYLLFFVICVAAYIGINMFIGSVSFTDVDLDKRDPSYEYVSQTGEYRIVRYLQESGMRKTVSYYVETATEDVEIPFGVCKKVIFCKHLHTAEYETLNNELVSWGTENVGGETKDVPFVEGIRRENPYLIQALDEDS
ncbi:MAG: hypothetical protein J1F04_00665 [Oscillospiraceae bacterium]|nr:hypothetical protein [Oscillospiraceae bacterium]